MSFRYNLIVVTENVSVVPLTVMHLNFIIY